LLGIERPTPQKRHQCRRLPVILAFQDSHITSRDFCRLARFLLLPRGILAVARFPASPREIPVPERLPPLPFCKILPSTVREIPANPCKIPTYRYFLKRFPLSPTGKAPPLPLREIPVISGHSLEDSYHQPPKRFTVIDLTMMRLCYDSGGYVGISP
jgi:hypothetical protein